MRPSLLVLFAPRFLQWPLAALQNLRQELPDLRVQGLVTGGANTVRGVQESGVVEEFIDLVAREHDWLADDGAESNILRWEQKLHPGALSRILLGDRHLSRWTVQAVFPSTPLSRAAKDPRLVNRYLVGLLKAVDDLVERQGVNATFAYAVAGAPAMAMAELAKMRELPFLILTNARFDGLQLVERGNERPEGFQTVAHYFRAALTDKRVVECGFKRAQSYLENFRATPCEPDYQTDQKSQLAVDLRLRAIIDASRRLGRELRSSKGGATPRNLRKPSPWQAWLFRAKRPLRSRLSEYYLECPELRALRGRFAYYPLHFDPEASTSVLAPMFSNQEHVIEALVKALPPDMTLLVKEHPAMQGLRPIQFYRYLRMLPRVRLVSAAVSSFDLIRRCELTCSVTGTAAWEAMLLRKPALVLGSFPFSTVSKGLITCRDFSRLPEAIGEALRLEPADDHMLLTFLAAAYTCAFKFPSNIYWIKVTPQMIAENAHVCESMASQLHQHLREAGIAQSEVAPDYTPDSVKRHGKDSDQAG